MGGDDGRYGWLGLPGDPAPAVIAISLRKNTDFAWLITTAALSESSVKQIGILARSCEVGWEQCFGTVKLGGADVFVYVSVTLNREEIDWPGLRAAAVAVGIRRAARQAAHDLPPDEKERFIQRAMKRCSREKWLIKAQQDKACAVATSPTALSANVRKGSDVLSDVLAEDSRATRIGLSAAARKAAETLAKMPGSKVIKHAQAHRHMTASSSVLHSWDDKGNQNRSR